MSEMLSLVTALASVIAVGAVVRLIILGLQMAMDTDDKSAYKNEIKHVLIVLVISLLVDSGALFAIFSNYFE